MKLEIISPEKVWFEGGVQRVTLPGSLGTFTVLERHAPLISTLTHGDIVYLTGAGRQRMTVDSGLVEVWDNRVVVSVD